MIWPNNFKSQQKKLFLASQKMRGSKICIVVFQGTLEVK